MKKKIFQVFHILHLLLEYFLPLFMQDILETLFVLVWSVSYYVLISEIFSSVITNTVASLGYLYLSQLNFG